MENKFKCKDEIIYRYNDTTQWKYGIFSHYSESGKNIYIVGSVMFNYNSIQILPYEGNEYLVGTTDSPKEEIKLNEGDIIVCSDSIDNLKEGVGCICKYRNIHCSNRNINIIYTKDNFGYYKYCVPFSKFNINDLEATRKEILKVEYGRLVKVFK